MSAAWDGTDAQLAAAMRSLRGQCCTLCNEPHEDCLCFDTCTTCGEKAYSYPRCRECGSLDIGYLNDRVRLVEVERLGPGRIAA